MPFSSQYSGYISAQVVSNTSVPALAGANRYIALHSGDPGADCAASELAGDGYARTITSVAQSDVATGKQIANSAIVVFPVATGTKGGQVTYFSVWDSITGGTPIAWGALTAPANWESGKSLSLAINALILTVINDV